jgi:hypothetical protein
VRHGGPDVPSAGFRGVGPILSRGCTGCRVGQRRPEFGIGNKAYTSALESGLAEVGFRGCNLVVCVTCTRTRPRVSREQERQIAVDLARSISNRL